MREMCNLAIPMLELNEEIKNLSENHGSLFNEIHSLNDSINEEVCKLYNVTSDQISH